MRNRFALSRSWPLWLLLIALPTAAVANVPIFLVFAAVRVALWWTILAAIAIEAVALWRIFDLSWRRAIWAALLVNIGTALLGFVVYPLVGMISYPALAPLVADAFGTGQIVEIAAYCIAAAVIDTPIELGLLAALSAAAGYGLKIGGRAAAVFFVANLISAAVLFAAIEIGPRRAPVDDRTRAMMETQFAEEVAFIAAVFEALPGHIDAEGKVDPEWRAGLRLDAAGMAFFELMVGTTAAQYAVVEMPLPESGEGYTFTYEADQYDGAVTMTRGTVRTYSNQKGTEDVVIPVVHYQLRGDGPDPFPVVRGIFRLSSGGD